MLVVVANSLKVVMPRAITTTARASVLSSRRAYLRKARSVGEVHGGAGETSAGMDSKAELCLKLDDLLFRVGSGRG